MTEPPPFRREDYVTPAEAAEALHLNPETVRRWARRGRVPSARVGGRWLVHRDVLKPETTK